MQADRSAFTLHAFRTMFFVDANTNTLTIDTIAANPAVCTNRCASAFDAQPTQFMMRAKTGSATFEAFRTGLRVRPTQFLATAFDAHRFALFVHANLGATAFNASRFAFLVNAQSTTSA